MTPRVRAVVTLVALGAFAVMLGIALAGLPHFGTEQHPYGDRAVHAAVVDRQTANTVSSVNFDQRALDTMGEEFILFAATVGVTVLLRRARDEDVDDDDARRRAHGRAMESVRVAGAALLGPTMLLGLYVVAHGALSPGGGFQGGVVLGTAIHLLYVAGSYPALRQLRDVRLFEATDAVGAGAFVVVGLVAMVVSVAFLSNFLPLGSLRSLVSAGTVPLLNFAVGLEVGSSIVVLIARFLEQAVEIEPAGARTEPAS
jgi:multicomponent Na+:H+ antiporter subunit B